MSLAPLPGAPAAAPVSERLVSVIIPCYNQARYLPEAIESALAQTYRNVEVVVVNDGSTDETQAVATRYAGVRCITQNNRGLAAARNIGLSHSRGEFVIFLDADDRLLVSAAARGAHLLTGRPELAFVAGHSRFIRQDGQPLPTRQPIRDAGDPYLSLLRRNIIRMPGMVMFRRSVLEQVGGFDSRVDACADYDMYLRVSREFPVAFHHSLVAEYRKHPLSMSREAGRMLRQLLSVTRRQLPHVRSSRVRLQAWHEGIRHLREYYGDLLAMQIHDSLRDRRGWSRAAKDALTLTWYHPRGAVTHAWRKIARSVRPHVRVRPQRSP